MVTSTTASTVSSISSLRHTGIQLVKTRLPEGCRVTVIKPIAGGYTNAEVLLCDVEPGSFAQGVRQIRGQYILKIEQSAHNGQAIAHQLFCDALQPFASERLPSLVMSAHGAGVAADLYEIAGLTLDNLRSAELLDYDDREEVCTSASVDLLRAQLSAAGAPDYTRTIGSVMEDWLGTGFPQNVRGTNLRGVADGLGVNAAVFQHFGEILPDPLTLLESNPEVADAALHCFVGQVHGDLHLRNIMAKGSLQSRDLAYWLIDISWSTPAPLLYDHAYLELAALIFGLRTAAGPVNLMGILGKLDGVQLSVPVQVGFSGGGTINLISRFRSAAIAVLEQRESGRRAVWDRQYLAARIAAGLNWAAKPLDPELRQAAFLYSAWAARLLLRRYDEFALTWTKLVQQEQTRQTTTRASVLTTEDSLERWQPFQGAGAGRDLILIADAGISSDKTAALASCRWAAVIDLDADSDVSGLAAAVVPPLRMRRHVSVFGENPQMTDPTSATNWLLANGWNALAERVASSVDSWRRDGYRARVRALIDEVVDATPNRNVAVLCLRSGEQDSIIDYVLDYIDERYLGIDAQLDLSSSSTSVGFDLDSFLEVISLNNANNLAGSVVTLPASGEHCVLSREDLNRLAVDLEVLHSAVLEDGLSAARRLDDFWRGRPPTWDELEAGIDVPRDAVYPELVGDLERRLTKHQLAVVHLEHSPGAGGTTLARRVAWNLHRTHPTVLLRKATPATVERIDELFQITGKTVLVVAEAADLPESTRDELINSLRQRNSRAVVLWVNRTNSGSRAEHKLMDPVTNQERITFIREFTRRATTERSRRLLEDLTKERPSGVQLNQLSPFYFGLCAYEAEFEGLEPFVQNHMANLSDPQRKVAQYLAMVTRFAQVGVPVDLVRQWLNQPLLPTGEYGDEQLRELLGASLRHLTVFESGELRLLHPLIADRVLATGNGRLPTNLAQLAVGFIDAVIDSLGPSNSTARSLLAEIFVRRKSWSEDEQGRREHFAEIIQRIPTSEGCERVFEKLTERCPGEAHFWNHRGRYHIYRVKGDYRRAEEFLQRAVEESGSRDSLHLHTLGMVRRFWIEHELDEMARVGTVDPGAALNAVKPLFDAAMETFAKARENSNSEHSWVTPVQLITTVVERLVSFSGAGNLVDHLNSEDDTSDWMADSLHVAETLLDDLRGRYAESRTTGKYYASLCRDLDILYGNLELLISQWRELRDASADKAAIGLALARAIYAKSGRSIATLPAADLREIVSMTVGSVEGGTASDVDLRLWFQAYRRLPEYLELVALEQFSWYASETGSREASYYLYIIHFLRWWRGQALTADRARAYLEECTRLSRGTRNQRSFEWLGKSDGDNQLVHYTELGRRLLEYDNFWQKPYLLRRVSGVIDEIKGPQAGTISIRIGDGRFPVFFSPRDKFLKTRDINKVVEFYVGFSYEGIRAWGIEYPGEKPAALVLAEKELARQSRANERIAVEAAARSSVVSVLPESGDQPATSKDMQSVKPIKPSFDSRLLLKMPRSLGLGDPAAEIQTAIIELMRAADSEGRRLSSLKLGEALQYRFGMQVYSQFRNGPGKLRGAVERLGFRTITTASGFDIDLA